MNAGQAMLVAPLVLLAGCSGPDSDPVDPNLLIEGVYWNIVTDVPFPANVAERDVVATFTLQQSSIDHKGWLVVALDALPTEPRPSIDGTHVEWVMERVGDEALVRAQGETLTYHFEKAGAYIVYARIVDDESEGTLVSTQGNAPALWQRDFRVSPAPGAGQTLTAGMFPIESPNAEGQVLVGLDPLEEPNPDRGRVQLVRPDGSLNGEDGSGIEISFTPVEVGDWTLQWDTGSVTLTDAAHLILRVEYLYLHDQDHEHA